MGQFFTAYSLQTISDFGILTFFDLFFYVLDLYFYVLFF
ncbi:hypothetical protein LMANV2_190060 [Leptospira interrogans serovar Manilae]|uniref:Uncharacterized protein n=1 Tax=Leptospira interrogans serovar Manilae TaxID=214675 RepID=A0AAQ1SMV1_LEPIR|nr:hypothetical protein LMANV2_190060 [Leptospira interrogans serovar Manilae]